LTGGVSPPHGTSQLPKLSVWKPVANRLIDFSLLTQFNADVVWGSVAGCCEDVRIGHPLDSLLFLASAFWVGLFGIKAYP